MANLIKEILLGIREELAFERSKPYRAALAASETSGFNTQLRDQLSKINRGPEGGPGFSSSQKRPIRPIPPSKEHNLKTISAEVKKDTPAVSIPEPETEDIPEGDIQALSRKNQVGRGVYGLFKEGTRDLTEEDRERVEQLTQEKNQELSTATELEPQVASPTQEDIALADNQKQLADFEQKNKEGLLSMTGYDDYRDLIDAHIKLLETKVSKTQNPEQLAETRLKLLRQYRKYIDISSQQIDALVSSLKNKTADEKSVRDQFSRIKNYLETNKESITPYEAEVAKLYFEKIGPELGLSPTPVEVVEPDSEPVVQEPANDLKSNELADKENQEKDYLRWFSILKNSDTWPSFQSSLRDTGYVEVGDKKLSPESVWRRVLRLQKEYADAKGANKFNTPLVQEALNAVPPELRRTVIRLLEIKTDVPAASEPIQKDTPKIESELLTESISKAETWEDLDRAIREAGFVQSGQVEYSPIDVLGPITDLRDAFKMADGNTKAPVFRSALGSVTRANGIRAKVLELLFRDNDEKYFKVGDRVVFEGKKWDIVRIENGKAVIQTLSEDKKAMPEKTVPLGELALEVKPNETQSKFEEDFKKPIEAPIAGGPETTAIPEKVPQWKKDFQAQVNKSFEAYRGRFYRQYRDESEVYAEYQRKVNSGWVGWLKDRYASFSTFGITDFHAAEKFRAVTGEAGAQIEFVSDALAREGAEANESYIRNTVDQTLSRLVKQFKEKRASDGRPVLTDEKLKSIEDRLIIELRAVQQEKVLRDRGELTKILRDSLDQKWWTQYVYGAVGTTLASINLSYAMPVMAKWIFGSGVVAAPPGVAEGAAEKIIKDVAPNAAGALKDIPSAWNVAAGENPWSVSEKLLRAAGKAVNPDTIKLVDAALCRENGIGVPEWAIPGKVNHGAVAVGTTLKIASALRVIASMP